MWDEGNLSVPPGAQLVPVSILYVGRWLCSANGKAKASAKGREEPKELAKNLTKGIGAEDYS